MICNTILEAMGNTPVIRLRNMTDNNSAEILVKFEGLNVGGSIKTRTAYNMICDAEKKELIKKDTVIVEPTSGNQGIGIALIGAYVPSDASYDEKYYAKVYQLNREFTDNYLCDGENISRSNAVEVNVGDEVFIRSYYNETQTVIVYRW